MTEVEALTNQISELKAKLKLAKKKEAEAKRLAVMKTLEEHGILDLDVEQLIEFVKQSRQPKKVDDTASK